jgi:1-acyl-sn-glycerol-3-phosphate acyltransferase
LGRAWLRNRGWRIEGGRPAVAQAVVIAAPHTSNWDLAYTLATAWALGIRIRWIGKHTLFRWPMGWLMRAVGGVAVDRRGRNNAVKAIAAAFTQHQELLLIIPPEGTRGLSDRWKTGFYFVAVEAKVPIVLGFLDFANKVAGLGALLVPTGDLPADFEKVKAFYGGMKGKYPALQGPITLGDDPPPSG